MPTYASDALEMTAIWLLLVTRYQRWSRGHKARGQFQGQGHKKNPRPRTAFPRTDPLEAKDRNAQGLGPRTQLQVFSKKKVFKKSFLDDLQFIGVPRIFDWGRLKSQITGNDVIKIFQTGSFCGTKIS